MSKRYSGTTVRDTFARMADGMTSFDEMAAGVPHSLIDLKSVYPISRLRDRISTTGAASVTQAEGRYAVTVESDGGAQAEFTSVERARYVAGYDGIPGMAINLDRLPVGNQVVEWGNTDFVNGFIVGVDSAGMFTRLYSGGEAVSTKRIEYWRYPHNTANLDPRDVHVYRMPYRWYAAGPYRLSVDFIDPSGRATMLPLDVMESSDLSRPVTEDPNQPINVRVTNNGTAEPITAYVMGRQYLIMGGYNPSQRIVGDFRVNQSIDTDFVPLISFRQKGGQFRSISTRLSGVGLIAGDDVLWEVRALSDVEGGTWEAPRFTDDGGESAMEVNLSPTAVTGGLQMFVGDPVPGEQGNFSGALSRDMPDLELPSDDIERNIVLCARSISGTTSVTSVFRIKEEW